MRQWFCGLICLLGCIAPLKAQTPTVAVAANMKPAMEEIYAAYRQAGGAELRIIYGASGHFMRQIQQGAPFHVFISADEGFPLALFKEGFTLDEGRVYAIGRLALIVPQSSGVKLSLKPQDLKKIIIQSNKVAIAKPELAPYGRAAVEFLNQMDLMDVTRDKLVYGENISMATQFVATGAAQVGFTAYSLAQANELKNSITYLLIPDTLHGPIRQRMVLMKNSPKSAQDFYGYLQSQSARTIIQSHGYAVP